MGEHHSQIEAANKAVEQLLREAVEGSSTPEEFSSNLQYCQILGTRILAVLIFNAHVQNKQPIEDLLERVGHGIKNEINDIVKASRDQKNLTQVTAEFKDQPSRDNAN